MKVNVPFWDGHSMTVIDGRPQPAFGMIEYEAIECKKCGGSFVHELGKCVNCGPTKALLEIGNE